MGNKLDKDSIAKISELAILVRDINDQFELLKGLGRRGDARDTELISRVIGEIKDIHEKIKKHELNP